MTAPLEKTWWVEKDRFLAGCYPGHQDDNIAREKLQAILDAGIRHFISLQPPDERGRMGRPFKPYMQLVKELTKDLGFDVGHDNFPILDMDVPDVPRMQAILKAIHQAYQDDRPIYVHCWGGHGRTGTVVGCWLREQGYSGPDALRRIMELRSFDPYLTQMISPQTEEQRQMVHNWEPQSL